MERHRNVFAPSVGTLKGYMSEIKVKEGSILGKQKVISVFLIGKEGVHTLIVDFYREGIIEIVEAFEWLSTIVTTTRNE